MTLEKGLLRPKSIYFIPRSYSTAWISLSAAGGAGILHKAGRATGFKINKPTLKR